MKAAELRNKTGLELAESLSLLRKEIKDSVTGILQGKEKNVSKIRALRKDVARVKTIFNEKKILEEIKNE